MKQSTISNIGNDRYYRCHCYNSHMCCRCYMALLDSHMRLVADLPGNSNLDRYTDLASHRVADLPGNWVRSLGGNLVASPLGLGMALGSRLGSMSNVSNRSISFSLPLAIAIAIAIVVVSLLLILVPVLPGLPQTLVEVLPGLLLVLVVVLPALSLLLPEVLDVLPLFLVVIVSLSRVGLPLGNSNTMSSNTNSMSRNDLSVMANNSRAVVHLLGDLLAHLSDHILTLLHMCCIHHCVYFCVTYLVCFCVAGSVQSSFINCVTNSLALGITMSTA